MQSIEKYSGIFLELKKMSHYKCFNYILQMCRCVLKVDQVWFSDRQYQKHINWDYISVLTVGVNVCHDLSSPIPCLYALARLFLVLPLCCCEEVLQNAPQILKGWPVLWALLPAQVHDVVQILRAVLRSGHPVAFFQVLDHLWVTHS